MPIKKKPEKLKYRTPGHPKMIQAIKPKLFLWIHSKATPRIDKPKLIVAIDQGDYWSGHHPTSPMTIEHIWPKWAWEVYKEGDCTMPEPSKCHCQRWTEFFKAPSPIEHAVKCLWHPNNAGWHPKND